MHIYKNDASIDEHHSSTRAQNSKLTRGRTIVGSAYLVIPRMDFWDLAVGFQPGFSFSFLLYFFSLPRFIFFFFFFFFFFFS